MAKSRVHLLGAVLVGSLLAGLALPALADSEGQRKMARAAYLRYCSACHGAGGKGDGVVSQLMTPKPTDLTQAAKANKGEFPFMRMMLIIDGRETIRAHGDPDMPVWGEVFTAQAGMDMAAQSAVRGKVLLITEHINAIQEK